MLWKLEAILLLSAIAVCESDAGIIAIDSERDEAKDLRRIASDPMHQSGTPSVAMKAIDTFSKTNAAAFRQDESLKTVGAHTTARRGSEKFKKQLAEFWKQSSTKVADADTHNGYISGALLVFDPTDKLLEGYEDIGGVGLVYLSWAGLAIGAADNYEQIQLMWALANNTNCTDQFRHGATKLTINLIGQGLGVASILGAGPLGGAVFGLASAGVSIAGEKLLEPWESKEKLDLLDGNTCDDWLNKFTVDENTPIEDSVEITDFDTLPEMFKLGTTDGTREKTYSKEQLESWDESAATDVKEKVDDKIWYDMGRRFQNKKKKFLERKKNKEQMKKNKEEKKKIKEEKKTNENYWPSWYVSKTDSTMKSLKDVKSFIEKRTE